MGGIPRPRFELVSAPTTYNLSQVYRGMGIRDPRAIPAMVAGAIVPVVNIGTVQTFAPQVLEARGVASDDLQATSAAFVKWSALTMQALSPGGTLIESVFAPAHNVDATGVVIYVGAAPTPPFAARARMRSSSRLRSTWVDPIASSHRPFSMDGGMLPWCGP